MGLCLALFAAGVAAAGDADTRKVHLDVEHALYGNLESIVWFAAEGWSSLLDRAALADPAAPVCASGADITGRDRFHRSFLEEAFHCFSMQVSLKASVPPGLIGFALVVMVAIVAVMAFDAVGRLSWWQCSFVRARRSRASDDQSSYAASYEHGFTVIAAMVGYVLAAYAPLWLRFFIKRQRCQDLMAAVSGLMLALACIAGPKRHRQGQELSLFVIAML